jgi:hypothetical protein
MRTTILPREQNKLAKSLKDESSREQVLYLRARALEKNKGLQEEMQNWDKEFGPDGLEAI